MTGPGTNGYIVGEGTVAIVDPGPDDDRHLTAWLDALAGEEVSHVLVTHAHLDHSGLARRLAAAVDAPVVGFGRWDAGRSETMQRLSSPASIPAGSATLSPNASATFAVTRTAVSVSGAFRTPSMT
jgi:hydroxyacylglutathione hydrolase